MPAGVPAPGRPPILWGTGSTGLQVSQTPLPHHSSPRGQPPTGYLGSAAAAPASATLARRDWDSHGAAVAIQAWWRGQLVRRALEVATRSACCIQAWWHRAVARLREEQRLQALAAYVRWERASVLLQAHARMWQARDRYRRCQEAARTIQAHWRQRGMRQHGGTKDGVDLSIEIILGSGAVLAAITPGGE
ncbi:PREDICTED: IQ domain-containing protein F1-like [Nipponia nippon]|uniref:IQ domain-containing protein F1-like n=1 Tax=Nipponia nippon TaxID=128390 RepID=UPI000510CE30|nr:PREDICTED: IQ domain-containing protein F1-like [Nipponia nippon]